MKKGILSIIAFLLLGSAIFAQKAPLVLYVNSKYGNCTTMPYGYCFQIKDAKSRMYKNWQNYAGQIRGLEYEEGYLYTITVKKIMHEFPPFEGINYYYKLIKVLSKKPVKVKPVKTDINDKKYTLYYYLDSDTLKWIGDNKKSHIRFDIKAKRIYGNDGCNSYFGSIKSIDDKKIQFGVIGGTLMACPDILNNSDNKIRSLLEEVDGYTVSNKGKDIDLLKGSTVVLRYSQDDIVLVVPDRQI
ncbi:DUF4377 domain-containing protein [Ferruginibacter sp. SUN002]|uniref:DUF4377 domain-containing protein n=1 Tax=Ferruginibacter sp. SUN002 TaxID=2937789 RepID=UPI003D36CD20